MAQFDKISAGDQRALEGLFVFSNNGHRLVKRFVQNLKTSSEESKEAIEEAIEVFVRDVESHLEIFARSKGVFILVAILEHSEFKEKLAAIIKKHGAMIQGLKDNKGLEILKQLVFA